MRLILKGWKDSLCLKYLYYVLLKQSMKNKYSLQTEK